VTSRARLGTSCLSLAAALCAAASCFAQSLPPGVDECLRSADEQRAATLAEQPAGDDARRAPPVLADVCPQLATQIDAGPWGDVLVGDAASLSPETLGTLARVVDSYRQAPAAREISSAALDEALKDLDSPPPKAPTLRERIQRWFDEHFARGDNAKSRWLEDWLSQLSVPERIIRYLVISLGIALVIATGAVVVNELRVAGVLAGDTLRSFTPPGSSGPGDEDPVVTGLDDLARAPLARRPALLLKLVLERLRAGGYSRLRPSLTHRELVAAVDGLRVEQSDALRSVATAAERVTFGDWLPAQRDVDEVVASGRSLIESLGEPEVPAR
jgi:hypothetical protein